VEDVSKTTENVNPEITPTNIFPAQSNNSNSLIFKNEINLLKI